MIQTNATITCHPWALNRPLVPLYARMGHSFAADIIGVPSDAVAVYIRAFKADGSYFDVVANEHANGTWRVYMAPYVFPEVTASRYEIHFTDAQGNPSALGEGMLRVESFSVTTTPIAPGSTITIAQIPTADGSFVQVRMVQDSEGQWVYEAIPPNAPTAGAALPTAGEVLPAAGNEIPTEGN